MSWLMPFSAPSDFSQGNYPYLENAEDPDDQMKVYCAAMTSLDRTIGRLLDYLDEMGLAEGYFHPLHQRHRL